MLKFTSNVKRKEFQLETVDGVQQAFFTEFTIGDAAKIRSQIKIPMDDESLSAIDKLDLILKQRLIASVKDDKGNYLFSDISELDIFPAHILSAMGDEVDKLNPWGDVKDSLKAKKTKS